MFLGFQLPLMQQLSGTNMIVTEIGSIVGKYDQGLALYAPLIANIVQVIATGFSVLALSYYGRRTLILFGNFGLAIVDIVLAVMFLLLDLYSWKPPVYIALIFIMIFMIIYGVTIGPTVWLYVPEIIPAKFVPTATCMNWIGCSFSILVTPQIIDATNSSYPVFFMFGAVTLVFGFINYFLVIETKGLSLV